MIKCSPRHICIITLYVLSRGNHSESEFAECLDGFQVLYTKFRASCDVVILQSWCDSLSLGRSDPCPRDCTHKHYKGTRYSIIDYILTANKALLTEIKVNSFLGINTSSHFPVSAIMSCNQLSCLVISYHVL